MTWKAANILEGVYSRKSNLINFSIADRQKIQFWLKLNVTVRPTAAVGVLDNISRKQAFTKDYTRDKRSPFCP
jgi:hypothetical protein